MPKGKNKNPPRPTRARIHSINSIVSTLGSGLVYYFAGPIGGIVMRNLYRLYYIGGVNWWQWLPYTLNEEHAAYLGYVWNNHLCAAIAFPVLYYISHRINVRYHQLIPKTKKENSGEQHELDPQILALAKALASNPEIRKIMTKQDHNHETDSELSEIDSDPDTDELELVSEGEEERPRDAFKLRKSPS